MSNPQPHPPTRSQVPIARLLLRKPGENVVEVEVTGRVSIGRAFDNVIPLDETCVSRYHAMIDARSGDCWLTDLNSRNGTTVNGDLIKSERKLRHGDMIGFGGAALLEFQSRPSTTGERPGTAPPEEKAAQRPRRTPEPPIEHAPNRPRAGIIVLAIVAPVVVIGVVLLVLSGALRSSGPSDGPVRIVGVRTGDNIAAPTRIRTDASSTQNILQVTYQLDDVDLARVRVPPYETDLDPGQLANLLPGLSTGNHVLSIVVEDKTGARKLQPDKVILSFAPLKPGAEVPAADSPVESIAGTAALTSKDISYLANTLSQRIFKKNQDFSPEFVQAILIATRDYRLNFSDEARRYKPREVANAFRNKGLDELLGFAFALSRSRFRPQRSGDGSGLWLIPPAVVAEFAPGQDRESLEDPKPSAELAASYTKALLGLFDPDDFLYAVACFGMTTKQAGEIRAALNRDFDRGNREDFWRIVNSGLFPKETAGRVAQFFAAGIVGEYPEKFGLRCAPLSNLYN
jgi:hypothetical protein